MVQLLRRPFTEGEARHVAGWTYPAPFDVYDSDRSSPELFLARGVDGDGFYPAVDDAGRLVAFVVVGAEARVRGQEPVEGVVDVGMGVRPDVTSRRLGTALLPQALELCRDLGARTAVRVAVASFNDRSLALCRSAGFEPVREFPGPGDRPFVELVRPLS